LHLAYQFLIHCYLGLGRTSVAPAEEYERKSVGTESTFREIEGKEALRAKLRSTAEELEGDLKRTQFKGRTLVLKVKLHTYEVLTRQTVPPFAVFKADDLYRFALPMLTKLEKDIPNMRLRLMGLRCTGLVSTQKTDVDFFGMRRHSSNDDAATTTDKMPNVDEDGWEVWPEAEFEEAARQERQQEFEELERLSQEQAQEQREDGQSEPKPKEQFWDCPICRRPQPADDRSLNEHIDLCLSRQTIRDVVRDTTNLDVSQSESAELGSGIKRPLSASGKKRGRPRHDSRPQIERNVKRKAFFS
jgi:DNA polymerase kappa